MRRNRRQKSFIKKKSITLILVIALIIVWCTNNGIIVIPGFNFNRSYIQNTKTAKSAADYASYCSLSENDSLNKLGYTQYGQGDLTINIENQGSLGLCWDFALTKTIETAIQKKYGTVYDFSERYVDYAESQVVKGSDFWRELAGGGSFGVYEDYMDEMEKKFLVKESNFEGTDYMFYTAFDDNGLGYCTNPTAALAKFNSAQPEDIYIRKVTHFDSIEKDPVTNEIITNGGEATRNKIKQFIMDNGAVAASANLRMDYYNDEYSTLFQDGNDVAEMESAHAFTIIGWDDTFPMEQFELYQTYIDNGVDPTTRMSNGAYICANSYGTGAGTNGYFFVSYYDYFIERDVVGIDINDIYLGSDVETKTYSTDEEYTAAKTSYGNDIIYENAEARKLIVPKVNQDPDPVDPDPVDPDPVEPDPVDPDPVDPDPVDPDPVDPDPVDPDPVDPDPVDPDPVDPNPVDPDPTINPHPTTPTGKSIVFSDKDLYDYAKKLLGENVVEADDQNMTIKIADNTIDLSNSNIGNEDAQKIKRVFDTQMSEFSFILDNNRISDITNYNDFEISSMKNQQVKVSTSNSEISIPTIVKQALDKNSKIYSDSGIEYVNCELSSDGTKIIIKDTSKDASITIKSGLAQGSMVTIVNVPKPEKNDGQSTTKSTTTSTTTGTDSTTSNKPLSQTGDSKVYKIMIIVGIVILACIIRRKSKQI